MTSSAVMRGMAVVLGAFFVGTGAILFSTFGAASYASGVPAEVTGVAGIALILGGIDAIVSYGFGRRRQPTAVRPYPLRAVEYVLGLGFLGALTAVSARLAIAISASRVEVAGGVTPAMAADHALIVHVMLGIAALLLGAMFVRHAIIGGRRLRASAPGASAIDA